MLTPDNLDGLTADELRELLDDLGIAALEDITTASAFARRVGVHRSRITKWCTRGYIDQGGRRAHVKPLRVLYSTRPIEPGHKRRPKPIYRTADLEAAELATRLRAPDRAVPAIAGWQRIKRAERRAA
ncbi:hypothetical protein [Embleya sp. NPDC001921]